MNIKVTTAKAGWLRFIAEDDKVDCYVDIKLPINLKEFEAATKLFIDKAKKLNVHTKMVSD